MKAFQSSIRTILGFILSCVFILSLASCAHHFTLISPPQISQLPVSRGLNGGSFVAWTDWQYRGSQYATHEFYYYYNDGNVLLHRRVSIPRSAAVLHFREVAFGAEPQWVTLQPNSTTFQFYPHHLPWQMKGTGEDDLQESGRERRQGRIEQGCDFLKVSFGGGAEPPGVPQAIKAFWQSMLEDAAQELISRQDAPAAAGIAYIQAAAPRWRVTALRLQPAPAGAWRASGRRSYPGKPASFGNFAACSEQRTR